MTTTVRATAYALVLFGPLAAWGEGFHVIRYDDCGAPDRQPHVVSGSVWTFEESRASGPLSARTVAFDGQSLLMRYEGLAPNARYRLRVEYVTERDQARTQTLDAAGVAIHGELKLPQGDPQTFEYDVPSQAVAGGKLELAFRRAVGPNAVVSEVWLLSDVPQPELHAAIESDFHGTLTVRALNEEQKPVPGAEVSVTALGRPTASGSTDATGVARFDLTDRLSRATGDLTVTVTSGHLTTTRTISSDAVIFRRPSLTPMPDVVSGARKPSLSLSGNWRFSPTLPKAATAADFDDSAWKPIEVPGEWVMQGFTVAPNTEACYRTTFRAPADWRGKRVAIRFHAVFSRCRVWLNGRFLGAHEGGFTPFEVDASDAILPGRTNVVAVGVTSEGMADTLASASGYARHALGGITRKVTVFALPEIHLTRFHANTELDDEHRSATLVVHAEVLGPKGQPPVLRVGLADPSGRAVPLSPSTAQRESGRLELRVPVPQPQLWDAEHPRLCRVTGELLVGGKIVERVSRRIGFREVEVRGTQLLVNGRPVKLHGVCRHEVDPERGRSLTPAMWKRDVELLKGANVNYVRTSHYPPAEEFIDLCDEAGIFVQDEGPWCWVSQENANAPSTLGLMLRSNAEMIERDRSHPSVIIWDLANESSWGENFRRLYECTRAEDPSRPTLFSGAGDTDAPHGRPEGTCEIGSWHYPGPGFTPQAANSRRPVTFDEYCHLNCYAPAEDTLDPGLRDYWGRALQPMWDEMHQAPPCLGGSIWCWADDVFDVPNVGRVGYGEWGIVDGWRRPKPEWWHLKKSYSPVRLDDRPIDIPKPGEPLAIQAANRFDFTNLSEVRCEWRLGTARGTLSSDIPPGASGALVIPATPKAGDTLGLRFVDATGRLLDEYALPIGPPPAAAEVRPSGPCPKLRNGGSVFDIEGQGFVVTVDAQTGSLRVEVNGAQVIADGPRLAASKVGTAEEAFIDSGPAQTVRAQEEGDSVAVHVTKKPDFGPLSYEVRIFGDGTLQVTYELQYTGPEANVREVGLLWSLPAEFDRLRWRRQGQWSVYPSDHIGRLAGEALAGAPVAASASARPPSWARDPDRRGCNDFRSTKYSVLEASLVNASGLGLQVVADGQQHVRATRNGDTILWRINDFANGGGEGFLNAHYAARMRTVRSGERLEGGAFMRLLRR